MDVPDFDALLKMSPEEITATRKALVKEFIGSLSEEKKERAEAIQ